ncbi:MAG: hypothetical protein FJ088_11780 [Deltaproteobacteria bacterium]|nr:hypothetical protein [Deltaproteobacteria bacterium]
MDTQPEIDIIPDAEIQEFDLAEEFLPPEDVEVAEDVAIEAFDVPDEALSDLEFEEETLCACENDKDCDDGKFCTRDICSNCECKHEDKDCNDGFDCTIDACDEEFGGCVHVVVSNPPCIVCDDDADCVDEDSCTQNKCVPCPIEIFGNDCPGENICYKNVCAECDDKNKCTIDLCDAEGNVTNTPVVCDDQDPCTIDACDPQNVECKFSPIVAEGQKCIPCYEKGDPACNELEFTNPCIEAFCDLKTNVCSSVDINCEDGDGCTYDYCSIDQKGCVHEYDPFICPEVVNCTQENQDEVCDDGDLCTEDLCVDGEIAKYCTHKPISCDDNNPLTFDNCYPSIGCENVLPPPCTTILECEDNNLCTDEFCDTLAQTCVYTGVACVDYFEGTTIENFCTKDYCEKDKGCVYEPIENCLIAQVPCSAGNECPSSVMGKCASVECLNPGTEDSYCQYKPVDCDDQDPCTIDACDKQKGCWHNDIVPCFEQKCQDDLMCKPDGDICTLDK